MIYSINEGLLDKFKKKEGNTTKEEFDNVLKSFFELYKKIEGYEENIIHASKGILERSKEYDGNNIEKYKKNFMNGKYVSLNYRITFKENYKNHENDSLDIESVVAVVYKFIKSCGFNNINDTIDDSVFLKLL